MDPFVAAGVAAFGTGIGLGIAAGIAITVAIWLAWLGARRSGSGGRSESERFPVVPVLALALILAIPTGCVLAFVIPAPQPASIQTVAAVEVPLRSPEDHADLLAILRSSTRVTGLHVDDGTDAWIEFRKTAPADEPPSARSDLTKTIYASLWRRDASDVEGLIDDGGHQGRPWVEFFQGESPQLATRARTLIVAQIKRRWPETRDIPVMPNGSLPLEGDLVWTGSTYVVRPDRMPGYAAGPRRQDPKRP